jgi:hypothetical protein
MPREIYYILGASNAVGLGSLSPAPSYANAARIYYYSQPWDASLDPQRPCNIDNPGAGTWDQAIDPIHSQPSAGVGFGIAFADKRIDLKADPELEIGLVPCAWGGTDINSSRGWMRGYNRRELAYSWTLARILNTKTWGTPKAILWLGGEADAAASSNPSYWMAGLADLYTKIKLDGGLPDLGMILSVLGPLPAGLYPGAAKLRDYQRYADRVVPAIGVVTAEDLQTNADNVHLNQGSQIELGHRFAERTFLMEGGVLAQYVTGDRRDVLTVTASASTLQQDGSHLVDGSFADTAGTATWFPSGTAVAGKWIDFQFSDPVIVVEARLHQSGGQSHGAWQWHVLHNGNYEPVGSAFTLGGATVQTQAELNVNTLASTNYRLLGMSGNAASPQPYIREIEFKQF